MYSAQGKFDDAAKEMKLAMAGAPDNQHTYLDGLAEEAGGEAGHQLAVSFSVLSSQFSGGTR